MRYISLITKDDFSRLYKFGEIRLTNDQFAAYSDDAQLSECATYLLKRYGSFSDADSLVFIFFETFFLGTVRVTLSIQDLTKVMPLTMDSLKTFQRQFSKSIRFSEPMFEAEVSEAENKIMSADSEKGVRALRKMIGLDDKLSIEDKKVWNDLMIGKHTRQSNIKYFDAPEEARGLFSMIMLYDRYYPMPGSWNAGFADMCEMVFYVKHHERSGYQDRPISSKAIEELSTVNPSIIFNTQLPVTDKFISYLKDDCSLGEEYRAIPFYFILKSVVNTEGGINAKVIEYISKWTASNPSIGRLLTLLAGCFWGYDAIYPVMYELQPLRIHNKIESQEIHGMGPEDRQCKQVNDNEIRFFSWTTIEHVFKEHKNYLVGHKRSLSSRWKGKDVSETELVTTLRNALPERHANIIIESVINRAGVETKEQANILFKE